MPAFNLGELCSKATAGVGRRSDISLSEVSFWVNVAYFDVANSIDDHLRERIAVSSTTSGENRIDLPTDCDEILNVNMIWSWSTSSSAVSNTKNLPRISATDADHSGYLPVGEPTGYAPFNTWMELYPSPNSGYSIQMRYRSMVTDMLSLTDQPSIATNYRPAILLKAQEHLYRHLGNYAGAQSANNAYIDFMARQKSDAAKRQADENRYGVGVVTRWSDQRRRTTGDFNMETDWQ